MVSSETPLISSIKYFLLSNIFNVKSPPSSNSKFGPFPFEKHNVLNKDKVIVYCGGGISATNIAFVLTALNYKNITIYDASLNEWAKDDNLPMTVD